MDLVDKKILDVINAPAYEMAYVRADAIDHCSTLGKRFVEHFIKICDEGVTSPDFRHHCQEMQSWWDDVKGIKLKEDKKLISVSNLNDWFFTLGRDPEDFIPEYALGVYTKLYLSLLSNRDTAKVENLMLGLINY